MKTETGHKISDLLKAVTFCILIMAIVILSAFKSVTNEVTGTLSRIGLTESVAQQTMLQSLVEGAVKTSALSKLKSLTIPERKFIAKDLFLYIRQYAASEEFLKQYHELREQNRPKNKPVPMPEHEKQIKRHNFLQAIALYKTQMECGPKDEQAIIRDQIALVEKELENLNDPDPALTKWMNDFPASPSDLINRSLNKFLEQSKDINFDAHTKAVKGGVKVFVNPVYENKPQLWKMCYRAGREATETVRELAVEWKQELGKN